MTNKQTGYLIFVAAIGMMCGLLAVDIQKLGSWNDMLTPQFIGNALFHFSTVIAAFVGGKLIPTHDDNYHND